MISETVLAECVKWSLQQKNIIETKQYSCPIIAIPQSGIDPQLNVIQRIKQQYEIGETLPLNSLRANIIGMIFIGRVRNVSLAWECFKEIRGPEFSMPDNPGVPYWLSNLLGISNNLANKLLSIHSGIFDKQHFSAAVIAEHLRQNAIASLDSEPF